MKHITLFALLVVVGLSSCLRKNILISPDGNLKVEFILNEEIPAYSLSIGDKTPIQNALLGLKLNTPFNGKFKIIKTQFRELNEQYEMALWKSRKVTNHCNEMIISLEEIAGNPKRLDIVFRAYNDGMAFRYVFPKQENLKDFVIEEDLSEFAFTDDFIWWSANGERDNLGPLPINGLEEPVHSPMVLQCADELFLGIHEAAIYDFANFKLKKGIKQNTLQCDLQGHSKGTTGMKTSWRAIFVGNSAGALMESNMLINLNPACKIEDTSWIKPGKCMWDWRVWGYKTEDGFVYDLDTKSHLRFIDFAAENNIKYLLMDADWYGSEFSATSDPTSANDKVDIQKNMRHAKSKGVGIILYLNDVGAKKFGLERVIKQFAEWGAAGVKYGFMKNQGQEKVQYTRKVVELCAKYKLLVDFHDGPVPPSGDCRTWPNLVTREYCHSQADAKRSYWPETAVASPFINGLTGSLDLCGGWYELEGAESRVKVFEPIPGTVAAENAKLVVNYSGLSVLADSPEEYMKKPDLFQFIRVLPDSFDEIKVMNDVIRESITVARRNEDQWFVGSLTNRDARTLEISMNFLAPDTKYEVILYEDAPETHFTDNKEAYSIRKMEVDRDRVIKVKLAPGGGNAMWIKPLK